MAKKKTDSVMDAIDGNNLGVFVGLVAVGKGRYEVVVLHSKGGEVTDFITPYLSEEGSEIHIALRDMHTAIMRYIRNNPSKLWMDNNDFVTTKPGV